MEQYSLHESYDFSSLYKKREEIKEKNKRIQQQLQKIEMPPIECLLCYSNPKNIVFLPCGHIIACKVCTTENLNIELNKMINQRRNPRICPLCKQEIKEAREVFL